MKRGPFQYFRAKLIYVLDILFPLSLGPSVLHRSKRDEGTLTTAISGPKNCDADKFKNQLVTFSREALSGLALFLWLVLFYYLTAKIFAIRSFVSFFYSNNDLDKLHP